ncbi:8-amino-7-oxononanoate synthase [Bradyrhizobium sp. F1.13.1]
MSSVIAAKSASYVAGLDALKEDDRLRGIMPRIGTDFSSSDYLALVSAPRMEKAMLTALESGTPIGADGLRVLRGNCEVFGGGYFASFPVLTRLPQRHNLLVIESLVHASTHEGARAGRAAFKICAHKGREAIESEIRDWRAAGGAGQVWIVVESLYIMDGVFAPVEDLLMIADRHNSFLVVGEVHPTSVCTEQGRGLTTFYERRENLLVVHSWGEALGASGAPVTLSGVLRDFIINFCCPFIFATAPSQLIAVAVREALLTLQAELERQQRLAKLVAFKHWEIARGERSLSNSQISPYIVGENARAMRLASALHARGFDIRGMRRLTGPAQPVCEFH